MAGEQLTPEQVLEMQTQIDAFNAARRADAEASADEKLGTLLELADNTLTPALADTLDQHAREITDPRHLSQLLGAISDCVRGLRQALSLARELEIAKLMDQDAPATDVPEPE